MARLLALSGLALSQDAERCGQLRFDETRLAPGRLTLMVFGPFRPIHEDFQ